MTKLNGVNVVFLDIDNTLLSFSGYVKQSMRDGFAGFGVSRKLLSYIDWIELEGIT